MRFIKKYWRLIIGLSFVYSGLSATLGEKTWAGYAVLVLGCYFVLWHAVTLLIGDYRRRKNRQK